MVIDANIIPEFSQELRTETGYVYGIVTWVLENLGIGIDGYISFEWENICKDIWFEAWFTDGLKNGKIRNVLSKKLEKHIRKTIRIDYGFPTGDLDIKYLECANGTTNPRYIMTYNYHFYEPRCMRQSARAKKRSREDREGSFCKYCNNVLGISIGMPFHCETDFGI